jgi:hypothetical protein
MTTTTYIRINTKNSDKTCYHIDPDCARLEEYREVSQDEIQYHNLTLCEFCDPDKNPRDADQDKSHYRALQEAANE